jgi:predicted O-methyltransferase YrrM
MTQPIWSAVDRYLEAALTPSDSALEAVLEASEAAGLPPISVSPVQGKLLHLLARAGNARTVLGIGTLGGYSTTWLARAPPEEGRLVTIEADPKHAEEGRSPFDLTFIDADKKNCAAYFTWALELSRPGSLIVVDNVVRGGRVVDAGSEDKSIQGVRRLMDLLAAEPRVVATALQTVGGKGYDGFALALVTGGPSP